MASIKPKLTHPMKQVSMQVRGTKTATTHYSKQYNFEMDSISF